MEHMKCNVVSLGMHMGFIFFTASTISLITSRSVWARK